MAAGDFQRNDPDEQAMAKSRAANEGYSAGWDDAIEAAIDWLRNEDIENDPDDLYTGRAHRVAAVMKLKKP